MKLVEFPKREVVNEESILTLRMVNGEVEVSSSGFSPLELLWNLEQVKYLVLSGELFESHEGDT